MAESETDPTFYRSAADAAAAPGEEPAYVVAFDRAGEKTIDAKELSDKAGYSRPHGDDFRGLRVHQVRLQGGDASSDSFCYS